MGTQTIEEKKDAVKEFFDKAYNLAIDHSMDTIRKNISSRELAEFLIEKLQALKS